MSQELAGLEKEEEYQEEEEGEHERASTESRKPNIAAEPIQPTRNEREEHQYTHLPYRSWCPHCVRGKARATKHKKGNGVTVRDSH